MTFDLLDSLLDVPGMTVVDVFLTGGDRSRRVISVCLVGENDRVVDVAEGEVIPYYSCSSLKGSG